MNYRSIVFVEIRKAISHFAYRTANLSMDYNYAKVNQQKMPGPFQALANIFMII